MINQRACRAARGTGTATCSRRQPPLSQASQEEDSQPGLAQVANLRSVFHSLWYCCPRTSIFAIFCAR